LFVTDKPIEALCLPLAAFYTFNIEWTPKAKMPLLFLVGVVLGPQQIIAQVAHNSRFVAFLRSLGVDV